ncbi:MAG TPA: 4Fe-4S dicluster domain-containing protein, partial [Armatimonadota bacterium]|nr:4Fe-4S dicluster domain-containing protein [Armatimonadota bacterium]
AIARAGALGVGVIAMCPVAGGMLSAPAPQLQALMPGGAHTTAAAALQFVLANPHVSCACSGMNTLEMLAENVDTVNAFQGADHARMDAILDEFAALGQQFCTACGYCMDCPSGVDIPGNFRLYNYAKVYGLLDWAAGQYAGMDPAKRAAACARCGACEPQCPNTLPVMDQLAEVAAALGRE